MFVAHLSAVALLLSLCKALSFTNSSASLTLVNTTTSPTLANATTTHVSPLPSSTIFTNQTRYTNGTRNACQAEYDTWSSNWWLWDVPTTLIESAFTRIYDYDSTLSSTEIYECTQTCGTICYAGPITTIISTTHVHINETRTYEVNPPYTIPRPNCTIGVEDCLSLQTSWSSAITSYSAMPLEDQVTIIEPEPPACSACISTGCTFNGMFGMSLYYWPVTTPVSRDYCASEPADGPNTAYVPDVNHTYVPTTTGPYAVVNGITMYQGNVYISYIEPRVRDNCEHDITRRSPGHNVLTIASKDLHSIRKFPHVLAPFPVTWDLVPWPVNYDDFNPPTPFSAYAGQRMCAQPGLDTSSCTIVKPDEFFPYMMMPPQIRDLDPNWRTCHYDKYAAFDPPIALHTRGSMFSTVNALPTSIINAEPVQVPPTQPAPGQSGGDGVPAATPKPGSTDPVGGHDDQPSRPSARPHESHGSKPTPTYVGKPNAPVTQVMPIVTIGPSVISIDPTGGLVIKSGSTVGIEDQPVTIDGTTISVGPSGILVANAESTNTIPIPSAVSNGGQLITIGPSVMSINTLGELVIQPGLTLKYGDPAVTLDGTVMSVGASGIILIHSKRTSTIPIPSNLPTEQPLITIGSKIYTVVNGKLILGPKLTLSVSGAAVILAGTTISMASEGVIVASSSKTSTIPVQSKGTGTGTTSQDADLSQNAGSAKEINSSSGSAAAAATAKLPTLYFLALACGLGLAPMFWG